MFGLRTKKQLITQHSPYFLMFGGEARYPSEVPVEYELDVMEWDTLIGAVCKDRHWTLVAMYPKEGRALFADPFGATTTQLKHCRDSMRAFMQKKKLNISRCTCDTVGHPRQQDSTSCEVLDCKMAELLLTGGSMDFNVDEVGINCMREEMARRLMADSDNLTELCRICGLRESGDPSHSRQTFSDCFHLHLALPYISNRPNCTSVPHSAWAIVFLNLSSLYLYMFTKANS